MIIMKDQVLKNEIQGLSRTSSHHE